MHVASIPLFDQKGTFLRFELPDKTEPQRSFKAYKVPNCRECVDALKDLSKNYQVKHKELKQAISMQEGLALIKESYKNCMTNFNPQVATVAQYIRWWGYYMYEYRRTDLDTWMERPPPDFPISRVMNEFTSLALEAHPDRNLDQCKASFQNLVTDYKIIQDLDDECHDCMGLPRKDLIDG